MRRKKSRGGEEGRGKGHPFTERKYWAVLVLLAVSVWSVCARARVFLSLLLFPHKIT